MLQDQPGPFTDLLRRDTVDCDGATARLWLRRQRRKTA
jgi:hypothetical protein